MSEPVLPLAGLLVLDISTFIAAPAAAVALADYGADVIKIEAPGDGDPHRHNYKRAATYPRSENNFPLQLDGRLKRSLALDLKKPEARPVLEKLVKRADIMIVNFPPPARERLKLRWEDIEPLNPRLVYCLAHRLRRDRPGPRPAGLRRHRLFRPLRHPRLGTLRRRTAGPVAARARRPRDGDDLGGGDPARPAPSRPDRQGLLGRHVALRQRRLGQRHDLGGRRDRRHAGDARAAAQAEERADQSLSHQGRSLAAAPDGARRPAVADLLPGDRPAGARGTIRASPTARSAASARSSCTASSRRCFASKTYAEWEALLSTTGIPFGVIGRVADVVDDEQAKHAGIFADTTNPEVPRTVNNPIRLGFAKPRISGRPSAVGENNEEILRELAYSEDEIEALKKAGALG